MTATPDARAPAARPLVEHFAHGLDAPICLTWELTYACNLACAHCLSVLRPARPAGADHRGGEGGDRRAAADAGLLREHRRRRAHRAAGLLGAGRLRHRPPGRREVLHQRHPDRPAAARRIAASDYVDVQISLDGATAEVNDAVRGAGSYATAMRAMEHLAAAGVRGFKLSVVCTRHNCRSSTPSRRSPTRYGAQLRLTRLRPSGRGADVWDGAAPDRGAAARAVRLAGRARRGRADRRLVLPPGRVRAAAAGAQPVRRRPGGLPDRPGRRRLRLPVRHPRRVPGRQRALAGRVRRGLAGVRAVPGAARAAERRRVPVLRRVRRLPGRLHGGEVLHRAAAGRPGPGVRAGPRRDRTVPRGPVPGRGRAGTTRTPAGCGADRCR